MVGLQEVAFKYLRAQEIDFVTSDDYFDLDWQKRGALCNLKSSGFNAEEVNFIHLSVRALHKLLRAFAGMDADRSRKLELCLRPFAEVKAEFDKAKAEGRQVDPMVQIFMSHLDACAAKRLKMSKNLTVLTFRPLGMKPGVDM